VHLTLNAEWAEYRWGPVAGAAKVPSLVDDAGCLWASEAQVAQHATAEDVTVELTAQIQRALDAGLGLTHIDSHMGSVFVRPDLIAAYLEVARTFALAPFFVFPTQQTAAAIGLDFADLMGLATALEDDGVPMFDFLESDSLSFAPGEGAAHNDVRLKRLPSGLSYFTCHASADLPQLRSITPDAHCRAFEAAFWGSAASARALVNAKVKTIGMRAIHDLWCRSLAPKA
jgi:hypothetical protein